MPVTACTISDILEDAQGAPLTNTVLTFERMALLQGVEGDHLVSPVVGTGLAASVSVTTHASTAAFSLDLMPGVYNVIYEGKSAIERVSATVPVAASALLRDIVGQATTIDSTIVTQALAARDAAEEYADIAQAYSAQPYINRAAAVAALSGISASITRVGWHNADKSVSWIVRKTGSTAIPDASDWAHDGVATPEHFGAVGDGVADDTAAFTAMTAASISHIRLTPNRTYLIDSTTLDSVKISGDRSSALKWLGGVQTTDMISISGASKVLIEGITLDGNRQSHTDHATAYYAMFDCTLTDGGSVIFDGVHFVNGRILDVRVTGPTAAGEACFAGIRNCEFTAGLLSTNSTTRSPQCVAATEGVDLVAINNRLECDAADGTTTFGRAGFVHQRPAGSTSLSWGSFYASGNRFSNIGKSPSNLGCLYAYSGARNVQFIGNHADTPYGTAFVAKADAETVIMVGNSTRGQRVASSWSFGIFGQADTYTSTLGKTLTVGMNTAIDGEGYAFNVDGNRQEGALASFEHASFYGNTAVNCLRAFSLRDIDGFKAVGTTSIDCSVFCYGQNDIEGLIEFQDTTLKGAVVDAFRFVPDTSTTARFVIDGLTADAAITDFFECTTPAASIEITNLRLHGTVTNLLKTAGASDILSLSRSMYSSVTNMWPAATGTYGQKHFADNRGLTLPYAVFGLTISSGAIDVFLPLHQISGEGATADTLLTINGGQDGDILTVYGTANTQIITISVGGNILLDGGASITLDSSRDTAQFVRRSSQWLEISRSNNGS
jgi:hypothetical protein